MAAYTWADQVLLAGLRSAELAGVYGPVATLAPLFGVGLQAINSSFAPLIAQQHKEGRKDELRRLYRVVTRWSLYLAVPPVALCFALPELVLSLWPHGSPLAAPALRITALAQLFATGTGSVNYLLIMSGNARAVLWNGVPALVATLVLSLLLIPSLGPTGAAVAAAAAAVLANGLALWQVWRLLDLHPFDAAFFRSLAVGLACFAPLGLLAGVGWAWALGAAIALGLAYLGVLAWLPRADGDALVVETFARKLRR
jgi:O-antigen/teichoic acid export membrane protein